MKYLYVFIYLFTGILGLSGQVTSVKGVVLDGSVTGDPLPGVNVFKSGDRSIGTITDMDGKFALSNIDPRDSLVFSFIGYREKTIQVGDQSEIVIWLSESSEIMDEIVITAIGVAKDKKSIGYAAQEIGGELISEARETNLVNALSSKVAGVEVQSTSGSPGASANIVIRGRTSISGSNSPLFVIDGIPIDNSFAGSNFTDQSNRAIDINPEDIENISVLKGAAATALYGMRAGNGAIIITTKTGDANGRTNVNLSTSIQFDQVNKLPERQLRYAQGSRGTYVDPEAGANSSWGPLMDTLRYADDPGYNFSSIGRIVGQSDPQATEREVIPFENSDEFFRTGVSSTVNLSVDGGNESSRYYLSMGQLYQTGIIPNSDFRRINLRTSGETRISEKLKVSSSVNYAISGGQRQQRGSNLSGVMLGLMRTPGSFDLSNGVDDPVNNPAAYELPDGNQRTYNPSYDNPYWSVNRNEVNDRVNRFIGQLTLNYSMNDWINFMYRIGLDQYSEERKSYWDGRSGEFRSINGLIINDVYNYKSINSDFIISADKRINDDLGFELSLGHNVYDERGYNLIEEGENFIIPEFYDISNTQTLLVDDALSRVRIIGAFYDFKLNFRDLLYLGATGRNDWSSTLPVQNNSIFYPSFSLSWILSEQLGLSGNPGLGYAKIRASYGKVGNDAPSPYLLNTYYSLVTPVLGNTSFLPQTSAGNSNLEPELNTSIELGTDIRFFRGRLGLDFTWYDNLSEGQIIPVPVAYSSGKFSLISNAGKIRNRGIEFILNARPVVSENFTWDVQLNFTRNRNIVEELDETSNFIPLPGSGLTSTRSVIIADEAYGVLFGTRWLRDENNNILIDNNGYPIQDPEPGIVGNPNPDWLAGLRNSLSYKNISLSLLIDVRSGGDIFNGTRGVMKSLGIHAETLNRDEDFVFEGVSQLDGTENTTVIKLDQDYYSRYPFAGVSEASVEDGSWIRLRELNLNYKLPERWLQSLGIQSASIGLNARNLILITDYSGIDPETNLSGASNSFGRDYFNTPNTRSVGINANVKF